MRAAIQEANDTSGATAGQDTVNFDPSVSTVTLTIGGRGDDRLNGGTDTLTGGSGSDFFSGGAGVDVATDYTPDEDTRDSSTP